MNDSVFLRKTISKFPLSQKCQEASKMLKIHLKKKQAFLAKLDESSDRITYKTIEVAPKRQEVEGLLRDPAAYAKIPEMPIYEPTVEEFDTPILLIQKLNKLGYTKYGCVKIKPPMEWNPEFCFNLKNKKMTIREQKLSNLSQGKSFDENTNAYTTEEFKQSADTFARNYKFKAPFNFPDVFRTSEYEYWAMVEDPLFQKEDLVVEYAADLPSSKFGSGFPKCPGGKPSDDVDIHDASTHPFNLNNISRARDSLFQIITRKHEEISGISSPWMYAGMMFASFCWHVEDLYMYSLNYMHKGAPKTWYCVPSDSKDAFDDIIKEKFGLLFIKEPNLLYNIVLTMNPLELIKRKVPVYRTEQKEGEFILTFPRVYHAGFSHGFNVCEAVNLALPEWIPIAKEAIRDYARDGFFKKCTFPYEWILVENVRRVSTLNFSVEGKERLLQEYELMKQKELQDREMVKKCYSKVVVKVFDNPHQRYDHSSCGICQSYTYLSYLRCMKCKKSCCIHHVTVCDCMNAKIVMSVRMTDQELIELPELSLESSDIEIIE